MFPQEIIDLVIDQLQVSPFTLKSCSLVSRRWTARSQRYLFARVVIRSDRLRHWCWNITPGPTGVSPYTTHLSLSASANHFDDEAWFEPHQLAHASDHLNSFTNVHTLDIIRWKFLDEETYAAPFAQIAPKVRTLRITAPILDSSAFLAFATFFNRADSIYISHPRVMTEEFVTPDPIPIPGTIIHWTSLHLLDLSNTGLPLLNGIAQLPLRITNLSVGLPPPSYHSNFFTALLQACSETLQALQLCRSTGGKAQPLKYPYQPTDSRVIKDFLSVGQTPRPLLLPPLPRLRSIQFCALLNVGWLHAETLLSITSKHISIVTVEMQYLLDPAILGNVIDWDAVDRALRVLEIQSQLQRNSEMVIRFHSLAYEWKEEVSRLKTSTGWLPRFEQVGVVEIVSDEDSYVCG